MSIISDEYQTPKKYIKAAIEVMGSIDLDPACSDLNYTRLSKLITGHYSQGGLVKEWFGNVWLNEPYSKPNLSIWTTKLIGEYNSNRVNQMINLVPSYTSEKWYHKLLKCCDGICLPDHRINHLINGKFQNAPRFSSTFFYLGYSRTKFIDVFSQFGKCFRN